MEDESGDLSDLQRIEEWTSSLKTASYRSKGILKFHVVSIQEKPEGNNLWSQLCDRRSCRSIWNSSYEKCNGTSHISQWIASPEQTTISLKS
jgi:hypothetical protein